jgi:hypothetical protein
MVVLIQRDLGVETMRGNLKRVAFSNKSFNCDTSARGSSHTAGKIFSIPGTFVVLRFAL